jgi:hypothetical protein
MVFRVHSYMRQRVQPTTSTTSRTSSTSRATTSSTSDAGSVRIDNSVLWGVLNDTDANSGFWRFSAWDARTTGARFGLDTDTDGYAAWKH